MTDNQLSEIIRYGTVQQLKDFLVDKPTHMLVRNPQHEDNVIMFAYKQIRRQIVSNENTSALEILIFLFNYEEIIMPVVEVEKIECDYSPDVVYHRMTHYILKVIAANKKLRPRTIGLFAIIVKKLFDYVYFADDDDRIIGMIRSIYQIKYKEIMEIIVASHEFKKSLFNTDRRTQTIREIFDYSYYRYHYHNDLISCIYTTHTKLCQSTPHNLYSIYANTDIADEYVQTLTLDKIMAFIVDGDNIYKIKSLGKVYHLLKEKAFNFNETFNTGEYPTFIEIVIKKIYHNWRTKEGIELGHILDELISTSTTHILNLTVNKIRIWPILSKFINAGAKITTEFKIRIISDSFQMGETFTTYITNNDMVNYADSKGVFIINNYPLDNIFHYKLTLIHDYLVTILEQIKNMKRVSKSIRTTSDKISAAVELISDYLVKYPSPIIKYGYDTADIKHAWSGLRYLNNISRMLTHEIEYIASNSMQPNKDSLIDAFKVLFSERGSIIERINVEIKQLINDKSIQPKITTITIIEYLDFYHVVSHGLAAGSQISSESSIAVPCGSCSAQ